MKIRRSSILKVFYIPMFSAFMLAVFLLTFKVNGHCAGSDSGSYFPMQQNVNSKFNDTVIQAIFNRYDSENNYIFVKWYNYQYNRNYCYVLWFPKDSDNMMYGEISSNGHDFSLYYSSSFSNNNIRQIEIPNNAGYVNEYTGFNLSVFSGSSNLYSSSVDYISNFNVYTNSSSNKSLVLFFEDDGPNYDIPTSGHATPYDPLNLPTYETGHSNGNVYHKPWSWTHYTWNTYTAPQFDDSSIINGIESIGDILTYSYGYLKDNISGSINNLGSNLIGSLANIENDLQYTGSLIVNGLNNGFQNLYDNFVSLLEPITIPFLSIIAMGTDPDTGLFSIPYLTQVLLVPDAVNVVELIVANDEYDLIESGKLILTTFPLIVNQLTSVSSSPTFHVPSCYYHGQQIGDFDISFAWFNNYKLYYDILINGFLIIGYIYWIFVSFSHHMRGAFLPEQSDDAYQRHNFGF